MAELLDLSPEELTAVAILFAYGIYREYTLDQSNVLANFFAAISETLGLLTSQEQYLSGTAEGATAGGRRTFTGTPKPQP